jgi:sterol desaturase/sphingolipid hydroxylase (fatty acid hydroxylase superfamily)
MTAATRPRSRVSVDSAVGPRPSAGRVLGVLLGVGGTTALGLGALARALAPHAGSALGLVASVACGVIAMLVIGSLVEWLVHRFLMHRRWPLVGIAYDLHHHAHHWVHYPPSAYLKSKVTYVPVFPPRPRELCATPASRLVAALSQAVFYAVFAAPILIGGWLLTANLPFVLSLGAVASGIIFLAVHVHDSVHCPGHSPLERFQWFWFLDHHHYLHHVDNEANTNFLLPLGDLLFGTLRRELTLGELLNFPPYEEARVLHEEAKVSS